MVNLFCENVAKLSDYFRIAPTLEPSLKTNMVCLEVIAPKNSNANLATLHDKLLQRGIYCAAIMHHIPAFKNSIDVPPLLRFCFHYWNSAEEVEKTVRILSEVVKNGE